MPLEYLEETMSTNNYLKENTHLFTTDFSGAYTFNQTKGKGQRGSEWVSESGENIALSFCLNKSGVRKNVNLSFWCSLVVRNFIEKTTNIKTFIKWPNDIILNNKKVCGILIETKKEHFIVGIGINVMQKDFGNFPKASSLHLQTNENYNLHQLTNQLLLNFSNSFHFVNDEKYLQNEYNSYLFRRNITTQFKINNSIISGTVREVDENGFLTIEFTNTDIRKFALKEVEFLY